MPFDKPLLFKNSLIVNNEAAIAQGVATSMGHQRVPSWNNLGRPKNAKPGTFGFNFQTNKLEFWTGKAWLKLATKKL